jgi:predicted dehydrogenase
MSKFTRRRFLEDSMLAAAAASTAGLVTPSYAAEEKAKGPNEKLSVAIIGVKGRGMDHVGGFAGKPGTEVTYVVDVDENIGRSRAEDIGKKQGRKPEFVTDLRKMLEDKSVDIVSIATPNHWHALAAIWSIQAGKDVYVEKPVSHNVSEGRRIVEAARKHNKICQTGTQCRSMGGSIQAIEFIKSGKIGAVKLARGLCYKGRGSIGPKGTYDAPASVDYDLWCGPAPKNPVTRKQFHYDWHWQWDFGNGDLGNQGIHQMDVARWGLGVNDIGKGVISYGGRFGYEDAGETANTQVSIHDYGDKTLVFEVRGLKTEPLKGAGVGVIFYGSEGYVVMTSYNAGAAFDLKGEQIAKFSSDGNHYENFVKAVRSRKSEDLNADIQEGHLSSALCHLGNISYRLGEPLSAGAVQERLKALKGNEDTLETLDRFSKHLEANKVALDGTKIQFGAQLAIDPARETFVGANADKANPMLTREYRAPFVVPAKV